MRNGFLVESKFCDHAVIHDPHPATRDRPDRELGLPGGAELANDDHIERCPEFACDFESDRHAATWKGQHREALFAAIAHEGFCEPAPGICTVVKKC
jgi:hypothetical protein